MSTIKPTSIPSKRLSETINGSAASFKLNNIEGWDGVDLTAADFGTVAYAVFRNSAGTLMEIMEVDPSTIAGASITINKRGLKFTGDLTTEVAGNKLTWIKGDTIVELGSHPPQLLNSFVDLYGNQTITGYKSFQTPTDPAHAATKAYVDAIAMGGATTVNKIVVAGTAGENVVAGNLVYLKSDGKWWKTDADTAATVDSVVLAIAQGTGSTDGAISGGVLLRGVDTNNTGIAGNYGYVSNTAGAIGTSAGTTSRIVGQFLPSSGGIYFDPNYYNIPTTLEKAQIPTAGQKNALAGTVGTPGSSNKYVTNDDTGETGISKVIRTKSTGLLDSSIIPVTFFKNGSTTYDISTANGNQNIAHGLGAIPKKIRIRAILSAGNATSVAFSCHAETVYNGTTQSSLSIWHQSSSSSNSNTTFSNNTFQISLDGSNFTVGTITFDATNIIIAWTKSSNPTGTTILLWEAQY